MEPTEAGSETKALGSVVQIDEGKIQAHLDEVVRSTVEETLNALLDAEADQLCGARRYERSEGRKDTRAGSLTHLSPIGWEHINLTGDYTWQAAGRLRKGKFRSLRPFAALNE